MIVNGQDIYLEGTIVIPLEGDESLTFRSWGYLALAYIKITSYEIGELGYTECLEDGGSAPPPLTYSLDS